MKIYKLIHYSDSFLSVKLSNSLLLEKIVDGFYNESLLIKILVNMNGRKMKEKLFVIFLL